MIPASRSCSSIRRTDRCGIGYETQLAEYNKAEDAHAAVFVVIDVGTGGKWLENLNKLRNDLAEGGKMVPDIIIVDGKRKPPASKM